MTYNFGTLEVDTYFYRPPRVKHGFFQAGLHAVRETLKPNKSILADAGSRHFGFLARTKRIPNGLKISTLHRRAIILDGLAE